MSQKERCIILCFLLISCQPTTSDKELSSIVATENTVHAVEISESFESGDIIFQTSKSSQSISIQRATKSRYSHMGLIFEKDSAFYVYEAVQPVKFTPVEEWIKRGVDQHYVVKRLKADQSVLTAEDISAMQKVGLSFIDKDYDLLFEWNDDKMYCSELVWKIYKEALGIEIGELQKIKAFNLADSLVQLKIKERYGEDVPREEIVISPESIFISDKLITVLEN